MPTAYRPRFHFSVESGWINDPNGLVYYDGEYHLFYQHHPHDTRWGPMHWGHAVSTDLVRWRELPIALFPDDLGMIFSGSAVIDWENSAGFGAEAMIALFTHHEPSGPHQSQSVAYSLDRGRSWALYAGNPVIPSSPDTPDFRDPKVIRYGSRRDGHWVMVVSAGEAILIYISTNLLNWRLTQRFTPPRKNDDGVWETPDLFSLALPGGDRRWVLTAGIGAGAPASGSGSRYFIGRFDGGEFQAENVNEPLWLDYGADAYAGQSWSDLPDDRRLMITWMNNWAYAQDIPAETQRGAMSIVRELSLRHTDAGTRLYQRPAPEMESLRQSRQQIASIEIASGETSRIEFEPGGLWEIQGEIVRHTTGWPDLMAMRFRFGDEAVLSIELVSRAGELRLDRSQSGVVHFSDHFRQVHRAPLSFVQESLNFLFFIDTITFEAFFAGGSLSLSELIFPDAPLRRFEIEAHGGTLHLENLTRYELEPIFG